MLTLSVIIPSAIATVFGLSLTIGLLTGNRTREEEDADATWRNIVHRNAITEPIPFASSVARVNAPGLVRVYPRRERTSETESEPTHTLIPTDPSPLDQAPAPAPTSAPNTDVQPACPAPVSVAPPADAATSSASAAPKLPLKLADEPCDEEREVVLKLWESGRSMTAIILSVWGAKSGGSARYQNARTRYKFYLAEARQS